MKRFIQCVCFFALAAVCFCACGKEKDTEAAALPVESIYAQPVTEAPVTEPSTEPSTEAPTEPEPEQYRLTFAGDCTLGTTASVWYADLGFIHTVGEDYGFPFRNVQCWFAEDDLTLVNLEGPLADDGVPAPNKTYNFRGPTAYANILTEGSVEAVSFANNHAEDYGKAGYQSTLDTLDAAGIAYVTQDSSRMLTLGDDFQVGIYAAMYYKLDEEAIVSGIRSLKDAGADFIIFAVHWGKEYAYNPGSNQISLAHAAIDAGADVVWGHHPHVLQPIEQYGDGIIFYSLGNFSFGGNTLPIDFDSTVIQLEVTRAFGGDTEISQVDVHPVCISSISTSNNYQPTPYSEDSEEYARVLEKLNWQQAD